MVGTWPDEVLSADPPFPACVDPPNGGNDPGVAFTEAGAAPTATAPSPDVGAKAGKAAFAGLVRGRP